MIEAEAIMIEAGAQVVHFYEDDADLITTLGSYVATAKPSPPISTPADTRPVTIPSRAHDVHWTDQEVARGVLARRLTFLPDGNNRA